MFNRYFYHKALRDYTIVFGSMFNNIFVERIIAGSVAQNLRVPLTYGPKQKFIAWLTAMEVADANNSTKPPTNLTLPRIGFEIGSIKYDASRRLPKLSRYTVTNADKTVSYAYTPAPYIINFRLTVFTKLAEDANRIVEQIIPFFSPDYTLTMNIVPELGDRGKFDVPIILNGATVEDTYKDGSIEDRRALMWNFDFNMKALFFGPVTDNAAPIKHIAINMRIPATGVDIEDANTTNSQIVATLNTQPGLTAAGDPTTVLADSIPYAEIVEDDPWDFIESVNEFLGDGS